MRASAILAGGADAPRPRCAPGSPLPLLCICPCCHESFTLNLSIPRSTAPLPSAPPRYALRRDLRVWSLTFDGRHASLQHERGVALVACLLLHPPEQPIHALDLLARVPDPAHRPSSLPKLADPHTGQPVSADALTRLQELGLARDDALTLRNLLRLEHQLEAILDSDTESEPVKQEALRDLEAIAEFKRRHGRRSIDNAARAADAVRQAIHRFHRHLACATDASGRPHSVLRAFAAHLELYLLRPRAFCPAGCFTYEPPPGVVWTA